MPRDSMTLYYRDGRSDKVYHLTTEEKDGGFVVNFAYGRRGTTLQTGTKTAQLVTIKEANAIYDKLLKSKMAKGYTPGEDGTPYAQTENAQRSTGILPQLLNGDVCRVHAHRHDHHHDHVHQTQGGHRA